MSVANPVIDHLDPSTKRIFLRAGVREYHPVEDIYKEVRMLRRTDEALRKYNPPVTAAGNVPKGGGKFTPRYIILHDGWRIVPDNVTHDLVITGEQLTDDGGSGAACIDKTLLGQDVSVNIDYYPPLAEIILVAAGSGVTDDDKADIVARVWDELASQHSPAGSFGEIIKRTEKKVGDAQALILAK